MICCVEQSDIVSQIRPSKPQESIYVLWVVGQSENSSTSTFRLTHYLLTARGSFSIDPNRRRANIDTHDPHGSASIGLLLTGACYLRLGLGGDAAGGILCPRWLFFY